MKLLTVIGARPQFVKAATISAELKERNVKEIILHTGQHFDANMSDVFFNELSIPKPDILLGINSGSHGAMTGRMLEQIELALVQYKPDGVLLYGDTNSTLAGALAAVKLNIPLAHVEAGLRSFNMKMPEEINRILTDRVSDLLFCPTDAAVTNLNNEAVNKSGTIIRTGDIMADTLNFFKIKAKKPKGISQINDYVLCTIHRAENTDDPTRLKNIIQGLNNLHKEHPVILPVHPRTKNAIKKQKIELRVHTIPPVSYLEMLWLLSKSKLVITDSGGLQKEAYLMNKMCITLRQQTEWVELVSAGVNILSSTQSEEIVSLAKTNFAKTVSTPTSLYGDGNTAVQIVSNLNF